MTVHIERITIQLAGRTEAEGRRLAELIANRLSLGSSPGLASMRSRAIGVDPRRGESLESLADRTVRELLGPSGGAQ